ncbi:MAG: MATE family efflux transporter [Bacteroidales bacterium]|nr:MATE family efflux transporter [Bacteroidales bacterium]
MTERNGTVPVELGTKKISSLLKEYAVPAIIAMTASSLYNMVDSIYIGHIREVGSLAISGLAVTFPLMNLSAALGTLVGVGASTIVSVYLGQKNYEAANKVLSNEVTLNTIIGLLFTVVTLFFLEPILYFFGASENTMVFAKDYMVIILIGNVVTHLYFGLNNMLRAAGNPRLAMGLTLFTVIFNSILDPVLIFGLKMGIQGAALATVIAQVCALAYVWKYFSDKNNFMHFPKKVFTIDWRIAKSSLAIGMGPFLMNSAACLVTMFINLQLRKYAGDLSIGAYGIINRISFLFVMVNMGLNQGMQPIAGFNYGARKYTRVRKVFYLTAAWATLVTTLGFVVSEFFPELAVKAFTNDPEMIDLSTKGIKIVNIAFPLVGFQMVATNLFQCLGMVKKSIFLSLSRQLLFLIPTVYFLPEILEAEGYPGINGVWLGFPISDTITIITSAILLFHMFGKLRKLNDGDDPSVLGGLS